MELPKMKLGRSCALSLSNDPAYVLLFATQNISTDDPNGLFAAAISGTNEAKIYSQDTFCCYGSLIGHSGRITAMKFDILNPQMIWTASLDGTLRYWDMKEKGIIGNYVFSKQEIGYSALDISCDGTILAAGIEKIDKEVLKETTAKDALVTIEFWSVNNGKSRTPEYLTKFESLHSDDITNIVFHPKNPNILITGSTDGLVTVLDITSLEEEIALLHTLNSESSVSTMGYFGPSLEFMYLLTHVETLTIWNYMEGELLTDIIDIKGRSSECNNIDYVIDCMYHKPSERLFLVGGTQGGRLEVLHVNLDVIEPYFSLSGGHSSIVRCISYQHNYILSGAEDGMVCAWMALENVEKEKTKVSKKSRSEKHKQNKPYKPK